MIYKSMEPEVVFHEEPCNWSYNKEDEIITDCFYDGDDYIICTSPSMIRDKNRGSIIDTENFFNDSENNLFLQKDIINIVDTFKDEDDLIKKITDLVQDTCGRKSILLEKVKYCPSCGKKIRMNWNNGE